MQKSCKFLILTACFIIFSAGQDDPKKALCIEIITKSKTSDPIVKIIDVLKKYPDIYKYIPSINPIAEKDNPTISSSYGIRNGNEFHPGIDFVAPFASSIHSTAAGTVVYAGYMKGYGNTVIIKHQYGFKTLYGHMTEVYATNKEKVNKGDIIGFLGSTGKSTGSHVHYEVIKNGSKINPKDFLNL